MRQKVTKVRQKSKIVMRQKCAKILRQKCAKNRIMSHQFCLTHLYHLTSISKLKAWVYPRLLSCARTHTLPLLLYHTFLDMSNFSIRFDIFYTRVVYFWKIFRIEKILTMEKIWDVSLNPYPKEPPKHPLYGAERKIFWGLILHLEHTFTTYI